MCHFASIQVADVGTSDRVSSLCSGWGVKATEAIPSGSFVCTVAGQVKHAKIIVIEGSRVEPNLEVSQRFALERCVTLFVVHAGITPHTRTIGDLIAGR